MKKETKFKGHFFAILKQKLTHRLQLNFIIVRKMDSSFLIHAPCEYVKKRKSIDPGSNHVLVTDAADINL